MKKMSTLFKVDYHKKGEPGVIYNEIRPENMWVIEEAGVIATQKFDGSACAIIKGILYKRFDAKVGKNIPAGAIPCQEPDPISLHHPHWVKVNQELPQDKYFLEAFHNLTDKIDGTYELCGPKVGSNRENLSKHQLIKHGSVVIPTNDYSFNNIYGILKSMDIEGIVFHGSDNKMCKIRKSDFGLKR
jgi:hypothetical protein